MIPMSIVRDLSLYDSGQLENIYKLLSYDVIIKKMSTSFYFLFLFFVSILFLFCFFFVDKFPSFCTVFLIKISVIQYDKKLLNKIIYIYIFFLLKLTLYRCNLLLYRIKQHLVLSLICKYIVKAKMNISDRFKHYVKLLNRSHASLNNI